MLPAPEQRRLLGDFLRARREALRPAQAGQPTAPHARRRTPGLRREEVAQLCGISATWYSWVEQGRDISLSAAALARLASALQLTAPERSYLFELARKRDPAPFAHETSSAAIPRELEAALQTIAEPAYLLDRLWQARAWNQAAGELFASWFDRGDACLLRYVFLDPTAAEFICDWENRAQRLLAEFRADTAHNPDDVGLQSLIDELLHSSSSFARLWNHHTVPARDGGERIFNHPQRGIVRYEQITLIPATHPDHKLVMLLSKQPEQPDQ